jgi:hypothetical protein
MITYRLALIAGVATAPTVVPAAASAGTGQGRYTTIDVPGAAATFAATVNDAGVVVGFYTGSHGTPAGLLTAAGCSLRSPSQRHAHPGDRYQQLRRDRRRVHRRPLRRHGFIDRREAFTTVNAPHAGTASGQGTAAQDISNTGVIVGTYFDSSGGLHGFELSPSR